jgi:S-DNA-T family DNA segregation ATPase FtsK/SpoIIIE
MLLRMGTKMEHLAAGGDADGYRRDRPAGRGRVGQLEVQVAWTNVSASASATAGLVERWTPAARVVGVVALGVRRVVEGLRGAYPDRVVSSVIDRAQDAATAGASAVQLAASASPTILVGDADSWQRQWPLWQRIRLEGEMLFLAECAGELRSFAGSRELPPYAQPHAGRAWTIHDGRAPRRVVIPALDATTC